MTDLDDIDALLKAATPGPLFTSYQEYDWVVINAAGVAVADFWESEIAPNERIGNARLFIAAPTLIAELVARVREGESIASTQEATIRRLRDYAEGKRADYAHVCKLNGESIARAEAAERELAEERHLATVRGEMLTKVERERDEARTSNGLYRTQERQAAREIAKLEKERDEARAEIDRVVEEAASACEDGLYPHEIVRKIVAERDARPDITAEDCEAFMWRTNEDYRPLNHFEQEAKDRVDEALRAHAARAGKGE